MGKKGRMGQWNAARDEVPAGSTRREFVAQCAAAGLALAFGGMPSAFAREKYPSHDIKLIVPWAPGGGSDTLMRLISNYIPPYLGVHMPVINMPGVSGTTGLKALSGDKPDGYTLGMIHQGQITAYYTGLTKQDWNAFTPVAAMFGDVQFLVVNSDSPWHTFADFVKYAKANPGKIRFGATLGGISQIQPLMVAKAAGIGFHFVGYQGTGGRVRALVGGQIEAVLGDISAAQGFVKGGQLRYLAVGAPKRLPDAPDVPTFKELGYDSLEDLSLVRGIVAPKGIAQSRIAVLDTAFEKLSKDPKFIQSAKGVGADVVYLDSAAYTTQLEKTDKVIAELSRNLLK
ncbi:MAG: tripartite tricarboxylate transporter substrate binding protein [Candidimonas sp.]|nr:MAG: tripartite tricarboxylate transporter substrate binding protein [Candidimonas sp.]